MLDNDSEETPVEADGDDHESANEDESEATEEQTTEKVTEKPGFDLYRCWLRNLHLIKFLLRSSVTVRMRFPKRLTATAKTNHHQPKGVMSNRMAPRPKRRLRRKRGRREKR